jgi:uncharacterized Zn finger protein (UPF0148 family)
MSSLKKTCQECGMPLSVGVANCSYCGATVGTLFSEASVPAVAVKSKRRNVFNEQASYYDRIENAKERANKSVILGLTGFFPFIGFFMGVAAIVLGALASKTLKAENVEDGRGSATAGLIIGALALIAQGGYVVYVMKSGNLPFAG